MKNIQYLIPFISIFFHGQLAAACFIEEVVDLYDSGYSSTEIRDECHNRVEESDCSIGKILAYASDDAPLSAILRRCEIRENFSNDSYRRDQYQLPSTTIARICATPYGNCPMAEAIPQGSSCFCPSISGPVWGIGR